MAAHPPVSKEKQTHRFRLFWIPATAAAVAAFIAGFLYFARPRNVDRLLAQAYGQNRTLELRFSGAQYGPIRIERSGNGQSILNQSPALLEALPLISRRLEKEPNNPVWLDAKGRADLLGRNYEAAIQSFQKALEVEPDSPSLLTDTASAYFVRAQIADRPEDYGKAIELLSQALAKKPDDPIALYNRALVNEKMFLFHQAVEDWTRYLQVAPKGEWAGEATQHLNAVRQKLAEQQKRATELLADPETLVREGSSRKDQARSMLDGRSEDYLDQAIRKWLPSAFPKNAPFLSKSPVPGSRIQNASFSKNQFSKKQSNVSQLQPAKVEYGPQVPLASTSARLALQMLADVLRTKHRDEWLSDLLQAPPSTSTRRAIYALAEAADANATSNFDLARNKSSEAVRFFRQSGNVAGELRAHFEEIYALERTELGKRCLVSALPLANRLRGHEYSWIEVQLGVAEASCWAQLGQFDEAGTSLNRALARAEKSEYGTLYLRALGIAASLLRVLLQAC